jgi:surface protein
MGSMFFSASSFDGDISKWDVSKVTHMEYMFNSAPSFNGDISKWDVSKVINMDKMFYEASSFAQSLCGKWIISTAIQDDMFVGSSGEICGVTSATRITTASTSKTKSLSPHCDSLASTSDPKFWTIHLD